MTTATRSDFAPTGGNEFAQLEARIRGAVITPGHPAYDDARLLHDLGHNPFPAAIIRVQDGNDVAEAIKFARSNNYRISVRSGGHSVAGHSSVTGAVVIDLFEMRRVFVDPETQTARVQPGATSAELAGPAHAYGLALSTGDTSTVGIGGLTLGGGIGWMVRKNGLAIDNLLSVEMVTVDGEVVRASATENTELFWGLRGGGGNFGIVTELQFRLSTVGSVVGGALLLPATPEVVRGYLDYAPNAPVGLTTMASVMHAPPAPFVPEEMIGQMCTLISVCFAGDPAEAEDAIAPLRALGEVMVDAIEQMPYPAIFNLRAAAAAPHIAAVRSFFTDDMSDESIEAVIESISVATSPVSQIEFRGLGGAMATIDESATAFAHRQRKIMTTVLSLWLDPTEDGGPHRAWADEAFARIRHEGKGVYSNFLGDEGEARIRQAYPTSTYSRLAALKKRYDPENLLSLNQNIRPA